MLTANVHNTILVISHINQKNQLNLILNIYIKGSFCNETIDYCGISKPCDAISSGYNINYTCSNIPVDEQNLKNMTYYCNGTCPSTGYTKTSNGFCLGKGFNKIRWN